MSLRELLTAGAKELGTDLSEKQIGLFMQYMDNLKSWNEKINLTAIKDDRDIIINHFLDSISIVPIIERNKTLLDIGTGGGFPGVPIKIVCPELRVTLMDSVNKKVTFLKATIRKLALEEIEAVWGRAEDIGNNIPRQHFDYVVNRAVGTISDTFQLSLPYLSPYGVLILMRGKKGAEEWDRASQNFNNNYDLIEIREFSLPYSDSKRIVIILKPKKQP